MAYITTGKILKVSLLPGILPRTRHLMGGGFHYISFYMAQLFAVAGLIPRFHPYLQSANFGRFGISHVTHEAWRHLLHGQRRLDQIVIFGLVILGLIILFVQFCFLGALLVTQAAHAGGLPLDGFLNTADPYEDLAFVLMDSVFGLPDFFNSCVSLSAECFVDNPHPLQPMPFPTPFHDGLHAMLQVYSVGLLAIAAIIFCYFCVAVAIETAEHGTPFGRRFSQVWAPIRMVIALALLIPIAHGLNASQFIVMYAAKWGSGFATNGWELFLAEATGSGGTILGDISTLIAVPNAPPVNTLLEFGTILSTCKVGEASGVNPRDVNAYVVFPEQTGAAARAELVGLSYADALDRSNYGDIQYVFGVYEEDENGRPVHTRYAGYVRPVCGEVVLKVTDVDDSNSPGSAYILEQYHRMMQNIWDDLSSEGTIQFCDSYGETMALSNIGYSFINSLFPSDIRWSASSTPNDPIDGYTLVTANQLSNMRECYQDDVIAAIQTGMALQLGSPVWSQMLDYNWAGAGIWYNHVARLNGTMMAAANAMPVIRKYPEWMEYVSSQRAMHKQSGTGPERYNPELANGKAIVYNPPKGGVLALAMYKAQRAWDGSYSNAPAGGASPFLDAINAIFGTRGLFELSKNTDTHPLAGLVVMGKNLMDAAIQNLAASTAAGLAGGLANFFKDIEPLGKVLVTASSAALQIAMIAMTIGFLLFYVLPFLPFLYFFFAVGGWVKAIFEAIVGVPLWALAHLRIDEEGGMSGEAAKGGYFMILEIFLRPILIIFGMLAGITIFSAQVKVLNEVWNLVVSNVMGFNATTAKTIAAGESGSLTYFRGLVDRFFYTVMYAIVVYMMGMASFKLVDALPNSILRWISQEGGAFTDQSSSGPDGMMSRMSLGAREVTGAIGGAGHSLIDAAKGVGMQTRAKARAERDANS